jgi:hypothetical protein
MTARTLALTVFAAGICAATVTAAPPPGPPWPVNYPLSATRSSRDAPDDHFALAELSRGGSPFAVEVSTRAAVTKPKTGNVYELRYQIRVHTKKGDYGPLLGTKETPAGVSFVVRRVTCEYDWIEFYESFDITRKDLSAMTNLPVGEKGQERDVLLRVEAHLYDVAEKKFLTPAKTPAAIVVASVGPNGQVWAVRPLTEWLALHGGSAEVAKKGLGALADLDEFGTISNRVEDAFATVLGSKTTAVAAKLLFIAAVDAKTLNWKSSYHLKGALEALAAGPDGELKSTAQKKLAEAK